MKSDKELEGVFTEALTEWEQIQGIRIWTDGRQDYMSWDHRPFLDVQYPPFPDPWRFWRRVRLVFFVALSALWILWRITE